MTSNLPPGCKESDIPGNRPEDAFTEKYVDEHYDRLKFEFAKVDPTNAQVIKDIGDPDKYGLLSDEQRRDLDKAEEVFNQWADGKAMEAYEETQQGMANAMIDREKEGDYSDEVEEPGDREDKSYIMKITIFWYRVIDYLVYLRRQEVYLFWQRVNWVYMKVHHIYLGYVRRSYCGRDSFTPEICTDKRRCGWIGPARWARWDYMSNSFHDDDVYIVLHCPKCDSPVRNAFMSNKPIWKQL